MLGTLIISSADERRLGFTYVVTITFSTFSVRVPPSFPRKVPRWFRPLEVGDRGAGEVADGICEKVDNRLTIQQLRHCVELSFGEHRWYQREEEHVEHTINRRSDSKCTGRY